MDIKEYFEGLYETFIKNPKKIFIQTFKVWVVIPVIIFVLYSFYLIIFGMTEESISKLFLLAVNASLEWWIAVVMNIKKAIAEIILVFIGVLNYYYFKGE